MKKLVMKKTAGLLVFLMTIAMLVPVVAFASAGFTNLQGSGGTVTGQVYVSKDVYDQLSVQQSVYVEAYSPDGSFHWTVTATYANYDSATGSVYYDIKVPSSVYSTYNYLTFKYFYPGSDAVSKAVYRNYSSGGGGGFIGGISSNGTVTVWANGNVDAASLAAALKADGTATINTDIEVLFLPASALVGGKTLTIVHSDGVSYTLPISGLDLQKLADSLGVKLDQLTIRVDIKKLTGDDAAKVAAAVNGVGKQLADAVDFKVVAVGGGKEQEITNFGQYVSRTLPLSEVVTETNSVTGVVYNPTTGDLSFVPTTLETKDGKTTATLKRYGNSIYTVVKVTPVSFTDIANHWAKDYVNELAGKLVVEGTGANKFEPNRNITRAEFAAMIVRALGLETAGTTSQFKDVSSNSWYAGVVAAAANAGIIKGYEDGSFKPNANITRKELAAMVVRAMTFAGKEVKLSDTEVSSALASYTDAAGLGWAKAEVAAAVQSGIVKGQSTTKVAGDANANRAEAATMVDRFLGYVGFIN